jgi:uncharacterized protein (TIGR00730 family)
VVVCTPDPEAVRRDRVWLEDAGVPAATPEELGLRIVKSVHAFTHTTPDGALLDTSSWSRALRRPAVLSTPDGVHVEGPEWAVTVDRGVALASVERALGERYPPRVAVFGGAWTREDQPDYRSARTLGLGLAEAGLQIVCGGYQGIMAAVCRGAHDRAIGTTFGITVAPWSGRVPINEWADHVVEARDLFARLPLISDSEAWVAFPGGVGTLKEVCLCWNLVQNHLAEPRPLVVVGKRWGVLLDALREALIVSDDRHFDLVRQVGTAEEAMELVQAAMAPR